jgi:hypothetical protein
LSEQLPTEVPPISVSISEDISPEEELSREEKVLKELKGVDEALARTIINEIVVKGDEVQWDDIGSASKPTNSKTLGLTWGSWTGRSKDVVERDCDISIPSTRSILWSKRTSQRHAPLRSPWNRQGIIIVTKPP